jgi:signal transduction histidine kinase
MEIILRPVEAQVILRQSISANASYGDRFNVAFDLHEPPAGVHILVDADRFMQVMTNLLSNAAKFSPPGSRVEVGTDCQAGVLRISVRDHGAGIPAAIRPRIFEKFVQGDNSDSRRHDGTGLGLNITQQLVTAMGGRITFESVEAVGTTFIVDIPLADSDAVAAAATVA